MIGKKYFIIISLLLCMGCEFKKKLSQPAFIAYSDEDISIDVKLNSKKKHVIAGRERYLYYGTLTSQLLSKEKPKEMRLVYENEESQFYIDTIVSTPQFKDRHWDEKGFMKDKIYVVLGDQDVDWSAVKIVEKDPKQL